jgi:hypothetical protein
MSLSDIAQALVRLGVVTQEAALQAERRKKLYGGGLDTALLELRATDEETLTSQLAEIIGIPLAPLASLSALPDPSARQWMDADLAQSIGAAPRARLGDTLDVLVRPEHDHDALVGWAAQRAILIEPALVCEARFRAHIHVLYDVPVPPRYLALLARLVGMTNARAVAEAHGRPDMRTPTPVAAGIDPVETLLAAARLGDPAARRQALLRLSRRIHDPRVVDLRRSLERKAVQGDPVAAIGALRALAELRDKNAVPAIAEILDVAKADLAAAAHAALVNLTCEDLGPRSKRWLEWWSKHGERSRVDWLLDGLAHRSPEIRLLASNELYELSGEYFGYHYDLPERDREEARQRWIAWWQSTERPRQG